MQLSQQIKQVSKRGILTALLLSSSVIYADVIEDADKVFNWGEQQFPQLLTEAQTTQPYDIWYYRYYPKTDLYVGVKKTDLNVYTLSGKKGATPYFVDSLANLMAKIKATTPQPTNTPTPTPAVDGGGLPPTINSPLCDTANAPQGLQYSQNGNTVNITTSGQCVVLPKTDLCLPKSATPNGSSVLKSMDIHTYQLSGVTFNNPSLAGIFEPQIKTYANIKTCIKNAPAEFAALTLELDGCFDVSEKVKDYPSIQGLVTFSPPVTIQMNGTLTSSTVADCFATDATTVTDAQTNEVWEKIGGKFVKQ